MTDLTGDCTTTTAAEAAVGCPTVGSAGPAAPKRELADYMVGNGVCGFIIDKLIDGKYVSYLIIKSFSSLSKGFSTNEECFIVSSSGDERTDISNWNNVQRLYRLGDYAAIWLFITELAARQGSIFNSPRPRC